MVFPLPPMDYNPDDTLWNQYSCKINCQADKVLYFHKRGFELPSRSYSHFRNTYCNILNIPSNEMSDYEKRGHLIVQSRIQYQYDFLAMTFFEDFEEDHRMLSKLRMAWQESKNVYMDMNRRRVHDEESRQLFRIQRFSTEWLISCICHLPKNQRENFIYQGLHGVEARSHIIQEMALFI